jgi:hypothetical protein
VIVTLRRASVALMLTVIAPAARGQVATTTGRDTTRRLGSAEYSALIRAEQEASYMSLPMLGFGLPREVHDGRALPLLYEATIAPPFFMTFGRLPLLIAVAPKVVLRQYAGGSYPVPPPSYIPRATAYWWGWPYRPKTRLDSASYAFLRFGHHSNGQEGEYFSSTTPPAVNYASGNFVTNYVEVGLSQRIVTRRLVAGAQTISVEWHPEPWMNRELRSSYGPLRLHFDGRLELLRGVTALEGGIASLTYIAGPLASDRRNVRSRLAFGYTLFSDFGLLGDFSLFANYYTGQDYYNIRFDRNISVFKLGAMAGARRFPR